MLTLPPVAPVTGWRSSARLARDYYVRLDSSDYSVHPAVIGRRIEITADLDRVRVYCDGRVWARHQTITDPVHLAAATALRQHRAVALPPVSDPDVEQRVLADYDTMFGLTEAAR
jgi:transposase